MNAERRVKNIKIEYVCRHHGRGAQKCKAYEPEYEQEYNDDADNNSWILCKHFNEHSYNCLHLALRAEARLGEGE